MSSFSENNTNNSTANSTDEGNNTSRVDETIDTNKGIIAWFARNSIAANLLMAFILIGGYLTVQTIDKQMFPQVKTNWISYNAPYPGTAPQEVEEGITIKIEEALKTVQGLKRVITYSSRNFSNGWLEVELDYDPQVVLEEVKSAIDSISSFPDGMERIKVEREKFRQEVMYISLYGDVTNIELKELGRKIHHEIQQLPKVNISEFYSGLDYEISIEVSKDKLREYSLSFNDVANAVRSSSRNMSAGQIRAENGYINLRVENQAYRGHEFEQIPLITLEDGSKVLLGEVATVIDGFAEGLQYSKFNGKNSVTFFIGAADNQSITDVADVINKYVDEKAAVLPQNVQLETWVDMTYYLDGRLNMMLDNMKSGGVLVFLMLALFLRVRLAFWVMMGLPVCFLGTLLVMPMEFVNITINVISLFAFILVLLVALTAYFYVKNEQEFEERVHSVLINLLSEKVAREKAKAFNFALALSQNETLQKAIKYNDAKKSYIILKNYMNTIETFSGSQVRMQIVSKDYTIFARSWDNTDAGVNIKTNRPDLQEVKRTLTPHLSFVAARRLVLIASIPIVKDGEFIAFLEVIQNFGELEKYFSNYGVGLLVLLDTKYEKQAVLLKDNPRISNMIVANTGANINHIKILRNINLQTLRNHGFVKKDNYAFFYKSILNADDENIGSFILILSKDRLKLFSAFETELDTFFTYARKDIYNSVTLKKKLSPYNSLTNKELLTLKNCGRNQDRVYIEQKLSRELQSYTRDELISLLLDTNPKNISRGKIK